MILLDLNSADDRPIYGQIADRVKFAVAGGVLRPGDLVPSVRELSKQLVVNPNTVARAYRDLQTEGLLESVGGWACRWPRERWSVAGRHGVRWYGSGCGKRSKRPGRARWTRQRSRPSSARNGLGGTVRATAISGSPVCRQVRREPAKKHDDLRGGAA